MATAYTNDERVGSERALVWPVKSLIGMPKVTHDLGAEVFYRCEDNSCDYISLILREPVLDLIEPRRVSRREVFKNTLDFCLQAAYVFAATGLFPIRMV